MKKKLTKEEALDLFNEDKLLKNDIKSQFNERRFLSELNNKNNKGYFELYQTTFPKQEYRNQVNGVLN